MLANLTNKFVDLTLWVIGIQRDLSIQLDLSKRCNLKCKHCYNGPIPPSSHHIPEISLEQTIAILDQYQELLTKLHRNPRISISGGEPLLSNKLFPLLKHIISRWPTIETTILTNGTLITDKIVGDIIQLRDSLAPRSNINFQISIDGSNEKDHDFIRGKGSFFQSIEGIKVLQKNQLKFTVQTILSYKTAQNLDGFFKLARQLGLQSIHFTRLIASGNGVALVEEGGDRPLKPTELKVAYQEVLRLSYQYGIKTNKHVPLLNLIDENIGGHGLWGYQGIIVDSFGGLKVSSRIDLVLGNVLEKGLENLYLHHPTMKRLRSRKIDKCGRCQHFAKCGGDRNAAYVEYNNLFARDPGCWVI